MPGLANLVSLLGTVGQNMSTRDPGISPGQGAPTPPKMQSYDPTPDLELANSAENSAYGMQPTQVRSNYGTKDLLALLIAGLAGERGGDILTGYAQGKQASQTQRVAAAAQADQMAQQKQLQKAAAIRAGIPFKENRVAKANDFLNDQYKIQSDAYNKDQSNLTRSDIAGQTNQTRLSLGELQSQDRRLKENNQVLMKIAPEGRADWARVNLGITDPDLLSKLGTLTPQNKKDLATANLSDERAKSIVALRPGQIKSLDNRNAYLASSSSLKDKQAITEVAKATVLLPAQAARDMAQAAAAVKNAETALKNVNRMITEGNRNFDQKKFDAASAQAKASVTDATDLVKVAKDRVTTASKDYQLVNASNKTTPEQKKLAKKAYDDASQYYDTVAARKKKVDDQYQAMLDARGVSGVGLGNNDDIPLVPQLDQSTLDGIHAASRALGISGKIGGKGLSGEIGGKGLTGSKGSKPKSEPPKGKTVKKINGATVSF